MNDVAGVFRLVAAWQEGLAERHGEIEDADRQWAAYIGASPAQYQDLREPDKDYPVAG